MLESKVVGVAIKTKGTIQFNYEPTGPKLGPIVRDPITGEYMAREQLERIREYRAKLPSY